MGKKSAAAAVHQRQYHQRKVKAGMLRVSVWIPRLKRDEFRQLTEAALEQWQKDAAEKRSAPGESQ